MGVLIRASLEVKENKKVRKTHFSIQEFGLHLQIKEIVLDIIRGNLHLNMKIEIFFFFSHDDLLSVTKGDPFPFTTKPEKK